jgi:glycosyltransferase involved in cell wall biosynthesis
MVQHTVIPENIEQSIVTKGLFIAWHPYSRRGQLLSDKLQLKLYLVRALKRRYFLAPLRYAIQAAKTFGILAQEKPRLVFVQNPPIFAGLVVYIYARLWKAKYVIDSHTGALLAPWWKWSLPIHAFLSRKAIATIVTNEHLKALVDSWRARSFIVGDVPTVFPRGESYPVNGPFNIAVINSFSPDEPLEEALEAASTLPEVTFYVTGNPLRAKKSLFERKPDNVTFTGFLPDDQYFGLLQAVQAVMTLTTDNYTMQRGACEAVWSGKPIITSDWPILREYFHKGTIHVGNCARDIREAVIRMQKERANLESEIQSLQRERRQEWQQTSAELIRLIEEGVTGPGR